MKYRQMKEQDLFKFAQDIKSCYDSCHLVFDDQNPLKGLNTEGLLLFLKDYIEADDSSITAILDDDEKFLYGIIIFDNIRMGVKNSAQVHIVNDRSIWGHRIKDIYKQIIYCSIFDILYAEIPAIAVGAIGMCRRLGFKKTGYIPSIAPYTNSKGEEKLHDMQIWSLIK